MNHPADVVTGDGRAAIRCGTRVAFPTWAGRPRSTPGSFPEAMPPLLRPSAPTAADAILCGDPARALAIAQHLIELPRISNHNRGLWGYFGRTLAGGDLTVQGTGIGGPSAVAVLEELVELGVERAVRVGTCAGSAGVHQLGERLVAGAAEARDGTSRALGAAGTIEPDAGLTRALLKANPGGATTVRSSDLRRAEVPADGTADMQTAAVFAAAGRFGVAAAGLLVVTRLADRPLADQPTEAAVLSAAELAAAALHGPSGRRPEG